MSNVSPELWQEAKRHFLDLIELDLASRRAALNELCAKNSELGQYVTSLLDADATLSQPDQALNPEIEDYLGQQAGPYHLVELLGEGGMGSVYKAVRNDGKFQQTVAIKTIPEGIQQRHLEKEKAALELLDHPGICRLIDIISFPEGRKSLVLEFIDGLPITEYADREGLTIHERLQLVIQVCEAVNYAHQKLILHRDLKPPNIFVDSVGNIKLLDFGIAKILEPSNPGQTARGHHFFTPAYASPEQMDGQPTSTSTDVFSLGVLLHQLVTGFLPERSKPGLETKLCSALFTRRNQEEVREGLEKRKTTRVQARRLCRSGIDSIVGKCLKEREMDRYSNVFSLKEDIESFLGGYPLKARPESAFSRLWKLVKRHRIASVAIGSLILTLATAFSVSFFHYSVAKKERDIARQETFRSNQMMDLLTEILTSSDPKKSKGKDLSAKDVLDSGARKVLLDQEGDPLVRYELTKVMLKVYRNLGLYAEGRSLLEYAIRLQEEGLKNPIELGNIYRERGWFAFWEGLAEEGESWTRKAIEIHQNEVNATAQVELTQDLLNLTSIFIHLGETEKAKEVNGRVLERIDKRRHEAMRLSALSDKATISQNLGDFDTAQEIYRIVIPLAEAVYGPDHSKLALLANNSAALAYRKGQYAEALSLFKKAIAVNRAFYGVDNTQVALGLYNSGVLLLRMGRDEEALKVLEESLRARNEFSGEDHLTTWQSRQKIAEAYLGLGRIQDAKPILEQCAHFFEQTYGRNHIRTQFVLLEQARLYALQGDWNRARILAEECLAFFSKRKPSISLAMARTFLGYATCQLGDLKSGLNILKTAHDEFQALNQTGDPRLFLISKLDEILSSDMQSRIQEK